VAEWNEPPKGTEFETFACEEVVQLEDEVIDETQGVAVAADEENVTKELFIETDTIKRAPKKTKSPPIESTDQVDVALSSNKSDTEGIEKLSKEIKSSSNSQEFSKVELSSPIRKNQIDNVACIQPQESIEKVVEKETIQSQESTEKNLGKESSFAMSTENKTDSKAADSEKVSVPVEVNDVKFEVEIAVENLSTKETEELKTTNQSSSEDKRIIQSQVQMEERKGETKNSKDINTKMVHDKDEVEVQDSLKELYNVQQHESKTANNTSAEIILQNNDENIKTVQENFDQEAVDKCKTSEIDSEGIQTTAKDTGLNDSKLGMPDATKVMVDVCEQMEISISDNSAESTSVEPLTIVEVNESEALKIVQHSDKPLVVEKTETIQDIRPKKVSRQESVADSDCVPDIEEVKDRNIDTNEELEDDEEFEKFKRARSNSRSSYEETLAGMDPEILKELGLDEKDESPKDKTVEEMDLSQLPDETPEERMKRIEEKAAGIVIEEDLVPRKSRSRSRSRSKSRPPNLETVQEQKREEIIQAAKFYGIQPSLDTIKESPSTASMLGMLQGGMSSASLNTVLQASQSTSSIPKEHQPQSPIQKEKEGNTFNEYIEDAENKKAIEEEEAAKKVALEEEAARRKALEEKDDEAEVKEKDNKKSIKKKAQRSDTKSLVPDASKSVLEDTDKTKTILVPGYIEKDLDACEVETKVQDQSKYKQGEKKKKALAEMKAKEEEEIRKVKEKATKHVLEETNLETGKLSTSRDNSEKK